MQLHARIGVADTKGAAHALARFGNTPTAIATSGNTSEALKSLPITALAVDDAIVRELARTGLKTIGQLFTIKSSELARRFGLTITESLAASVGHAPDPVTPAAADPIYAARMTTPEPLGYKSDIENILNRLSESVCEQLAKEQKGARRFDLTLRCVDTGDQTLSIGFTRPCAEPRSILQQFARPLDQLKIEFGADWFRLVADHVEPIPPRQIVFGQETQQEENTARLITTLGNRLGFDHVRKFTAKDSHLPEREFASLDAITDKFDPVWQACPRKRPVRLYQTPERLRTMTLGRPPTHFQWRRISYETKTAMGPERLTPAWWRDNDLRTRDYWTVQTTNGARLWLLTYPGENEPAWFVAGQFT